MIPSDFHFLRPYWLLALIALVVCLYAFYRRRLKQGTWAEVCDPQLLDWLLVDKPVKRQTYRLYWMLVAGIIAILALAGPSWEKLPVPVFRSQSALILVLDLSESMYANDLKPNRIARARFKITDILRQRKDGQSALIVYSDAAFVVTPLSNDTETIIHQLKVLEPSLMPGQGNNTKAAMVLAAKLFKQAGVQSGQVLLVSDSGGSRSSAISAAKEVSKRGHQLFILGVGTEAGAPIPQAGGFVKDANGSILIPKLNQSDLKSMADAGNGIYRKIRSGNTDIKQLIDAIDQSESTDVSKQAVSEINQWKDRGPWLVLLLIPLAALAFRRGYIAVIFIGLTSVSPDSYALSWDDLWSNTNQRGQTAFNNNQYDAAANHFNSPEWKAASHYRAGQFDKAAGILKQLPETSDNLYNLGNAQAKQQQLQDAKKSYQQALQLNPDNVDAQHNKDIVEQALKKQKQQQQNQDKNQQSDEESDSSEQQDQQQSDSQDEQNNEQQQSDNSEQQQQSEQSKGEDSSEQEDEQTSAQEQDHNDEEDGEDSKQSEENSDQDDAEQQKQEQGQPMQSDDEQPLDELDQATEQWMRRIPDDPGRLLRRKFLYQYNRKNNSRLRQK